MIQVPKGVSEEAYRLLDLDIDYIYSDHLELTESPIEALFATAFVLLAEDGAIK